jgi:hypothetical protein
MIGTPSRLRPRDEFRDRVEALDLVRSDIGGGDLWVGGREKFRRRCGKRGREGGSRRGQRTGALIPPCQGPMAADDDEVGRRGTRAQIQGKGKRKQEIKCRVLHSLPPNLPLLPLYTEE